MCLLFLGNKNAIIKWGIFLTVLFVPKIALKREIKMHFWVRLFFYWVFKLFYVHVSILCTKKIFIKAIEEDCRFDFLKRMCLLEICRFFTDFELLDEIFYYYYAHLTGVHLLLKLKIIPLLWYNFDFRWLLVLLYKQKIRLYIVSYIMHVCKCYYLINSTYTAS